MWTTLSVEQSVQEFCANYVQIAALLQHHLFTEDLPLISDHDPPQEYQKLCQFLNLRPTPESPAAPRPSSCSSAAGRPVSDMMGKTGVHWFCEQPELLLKAWCRHLMQYANKQAIVARVSYFSLCLSHIQGTLLNLACYGSATHILFHAS